MGKTDEEDFLRVSTSMTIGYPSIYGSLYGDKLTSLLPSCGNYSG